MKSLKKILILPGLAVAFFVLFQAGALSVPEAHAAISLIASTGTIAATDATITTPAVNTTGATLLVVSTQGFATTSALSDNMGNTWHTLPAYGVASGSGFTQIWYAYNPITSSTQTFTAAGGGGQYPSIDVTAWSGTATSSSVLESYDGNTNTGGDTIQPGARGALNVGDLIVTTYTGDASHNSFLVDSGFTISNTESNANTSMDGVMAYLLATSTSTVDPTWTASGGTKNSSALAVFKIAGGAGTDTTPPSIQITSPANDSTATGVITLTASTTDNVGVQSVQLQVDGVNAGSAVTSTNDIFSTSFNTNLYSNATHTITAVAADAAGNTASSSVTVTFANNSTVWAYRGGALESGWIKASYGTNTSTYANTTFVYPGSTSSLEDVFDSGDLGLVNNGTYELYPQNYGYFQFAVYTTSTPLSLSMNLGGYFGGDATSGPTVSLGSITPDQWNLFEVPMSTLEPNSYAFRGIFLYPSATSTFFVDSVGFLGATSTPGPGISITSPSANATVSSTIIVDASSSGAAAIQNVQFFMGTSTSLGIATSSSNTYSVSWNTGLASNGTTTLKAVATDANGNQASSSIAVTVDNIDNTPPTVAITSPANDSIATGTVVLTATSSDNVAVKNVQFELNGANLGSAITSPPYTYSWDTQMYANGTDTITAVSTDTSGNSASSSITVIVDNPPDTTPPSIQITSPANDSTATGTLTITASSTDNIAVQGVQFQINGSDIGSAVTSTNSIFSTTVNTNLYQNGTDTLTAISTDTSGNTASTSITLVIANNVTNWIYQGGGLTPPWTSDTYGTSTVTYNDTSTVYTGSTSSLKAVYTSGAVGFFGFAGCTGQVLYPSNYNSLQFALYATSSESFSVQLTNYCSGATSSAVYTATTTANQWALFSIPMRTLEPNGYTFDSVYFSPPGATTFYLDDMGLMAKTDITPPSVAFTSPASGATVSSTVTIAATSSDNVAVESVQFELNGANLGSAITSPPYTYSWNTLLSSNGTTTLTAISTDTSGNTSTVSEAVNVYNAPDTTPPSVSITSPAANATVSNTITLTASSTDNRAVANVQFQVNGVDAGSAVTSTNTIYSTTLNTALYANGTTTLTAISTDTSGNTSTASISVVFSNSAVAASLLSASSTCFGSSGCANTANATTSSLSFPGGVERKGDLLIAWTNWYDWEPTSTITDTAGNDWVPIYTGEFTNANNLYSVWYALATTTGTDTVTIDFPSAVFGNFGISEFDTPGITSTSTLDATGINPSIGSTSTPLVATTTAAVFAPDELVIGFAGSSQYAGTYTAGSGFLIPSGGMVSGSTENSAALEWMNESTATGIATATMTTTAPNASIGVITFKTDTVSPSISLTSPSDGATVSSTITLAATASDNVAVKNVQFQVDGSNIGSAVTSAPYSTAWVTGTTANGTHTVTAIATDTNGNTASSSVTVTLNNPTDTTPPTVSISAPTASSTVSGTTTLTAVASDNVAVRSVEFEANGYSIGTVTSSPYTMQWDTDYTFDGSNVITAIATDYAGNTSTATTTVTVKNTTPLATGQKWVSAYYATWLEGNQYSGWLRPWQIDYNALTNIDLFGVNPTATGTLTGDDSWDMPNAVYYAHLNGRKIFITCGSAYDGANYDSSMSPTYRQTFINNLVDEMTKWGFDGIDLDIEPIYSTDTNFQDFIPLLKAAMQKVNPNAELTLAQDGTVPTSTIQYFDEINIMSYDMTYPFGGGWVSWFNSPIYNGGQTFYSTGGPLPAIDLNVNQDESQSIPASKIGIGVEFYGMTWNGGSICAPLQKFDGSSSTVKLDIADYSLMQEYPTSSMLFDATSGESYASNCVASSSPSNYFVSYDNEQAIAAKADYINTKGIGGLIIYELGGAYLSTSTSLVKDPFLRAVGADLIISTTTASTTIQSVGAETGLTVSYGTAFANLNLPSTAAATLSNNTETAIPVSWAAGSYDGNTAGTYTLTGTLNSLPSTITNPSNLTASVNVTVSSSTIYTISNVVSPASVSTTDGTSFGSLTLPSTVQVVLSNGSYGTASVSWAAGSYDGNTAGTYHLVGTLTSLPSNTLNSSNLSAFMDVVVGSQSGGATSGGGGGGGGYSPEVFQILQNNPPQKSSPSASAPVVAPIFRLSFIPTYGRTDTTNKTLQEFLASQNLFPKNLETGYFGPLTLKAVKEFQCKEHIVCSGTAWTTGWGHVGPKTKAMIEKMQSGPSFTPAQVSSVVNLLNAFGVAESKVLEIENLLKGGTGQ